VGVAFSLDLLRKAERERVQEKENGCAYREKREVIVITWGGGGGL